MARNYASSKSHNVIGLISGTSCDGIDAVCVRLTGKGLSLKFKLLACRTFPYPPKVYRLLLDLLRYPEVPLQVVSNLNFLLGKIFAGAARRIAAHAGKALSQVDLIASHGQTLYHQPQYSALAGFKVRSTLQLGEIAVIAQDTGVTAAGEFRYADMAAGGQGAPLVPYFDYLMFRHPRKTRIVLNIGGIANLTCIPPAASAREVLSCDTGPGNALLDAVIRERTGGKKTYDKDGALAAKGRIQPELLAELMSDAYFNQPPPKSTGKERFGSELAVRLAAKELSLEDLLATLTAWTAHSIAGHISRFFPAALKGDGFYSGGGGHNRTLMRMLQSQLPDMHFFPTEAAGIPGDFKEALAFAVMGHELLLGNSASLPQCTGAGQPVLLGKIALAG